MSDWLKLHRKSLESRVFSDPKLWRLWCWCLLKSNWKRGWYLGCEIQPGQFAIGREAASEELGVSGSSWYRAMQKLQELGCIKLQANSRFTIVSIVNWAKYQADANSNRTAGEQRVNSQRTASEQQVDTIEEGLEGIERKNNSLSRHLESERFSVAWDAWKNKQAVNSGRMMDSATEHGQLFLLEGFATEEAVAIVEYSVSRTTCRNLILNGDHKPKAKQTESSSTKPNSKRAELLEALGVTE